MNKLEVQNQGESSKGHSQTHQHTSQGAYTSSPKKAGGQQGSSTSISSLSVQQLQDMITNTIRAQYGGHHKTLWCIQNHTPRGLTFYRCLRVTNLLSFNSSMEKGIRSNISLISSRLAITLVRMGTCSLSNSCVLFEETPLIGTWILSLSPLIVGSRWKGNSWIISTVLDVL